MNTNQSHAAFRRAQAVIPGGVNSPVRAFGGVGGTPLHIARGAGPYLYDVDENRFIDYIQSWGPLILGHAHPDVVAALSDAAQRSRNSPRQLRRSDAAPALSDAARRSQTPRNVLKCRTVLRRRIEAAVFA